MPQRYDMNTPTPSTPDLSEFLKLSNPRTRPCPVGTALAVLTDEEREQYEAASNTSPGLITNIALAKWLERHAQGDWTGGWQNALAHRTCKSTGERRCTCDG
jgi:hypothetical protein